jgi:hypothetical protein
MIKQLNFSMSCFRFMMFLQLARRPIYPTEVQSKLKPRKTEISLCTCAETLAKSIRLQERQSNSKMLPITDELPSASI